MILSQGHPQGQPTTEVPTLSATIPNRPQVNGGSASHLAGAFNDPQINGDTMTQPTKAYTNPQSNITSQFIYILGLPYVNPVVLNHVVESVIVEKLQELS